jgi:ComEC/Rec2-related protein
VIGGLWLILLCSCWLLGIVIGDLCRLDPRMVGFATAATAVGALLARPKPGARLLAAAVCAVALGATRASLSPPPESSARLDPYLGADVRVAGVLSEPVRPLSSPLTTASASSVRAYDLLLLDATAVAPAGRDASADADLASQIDPVQVRVLLDRTIAVTDSSLVSAPDLLPGDALVVDGRLLPSHSGPGPPTLFAARAQRTSSGTPSLAAPGSDLRFAMARLRAAVDANLHRYLPDPQASFASGVLLGGSGPPDGDFRLQLQRSGLAHLLAIDGYKMVVVGGAVSAALVRFLGPQLAALPICLTLLGYTLLTGAHAAAVRAAIMAGLTTVAAVGGRLADPLTSLLLAAAVMGAVDPHVPLDLGFQLSFSATLGLILLWPRIHRRLRRLPKPLAEPAGVTVTVSLATLPVTVAAFQSVSLVSPLAHIAAVPLVPVVMLSATALAAAAPFPILATPLGWAAWVPATLLVEVVRVAGGAPGAAVTTGRPPPLLGMALAVALLVWGLAGLPECATSIAALRQLIPWRGWSWLPMVMPACLLLAVSAGMVRSARPDGLLHVSGLNSGRGQAAFVRGPTGKTLLVVQGRVDGALLQREVADRLAVWEHHLDFVVALDDDAASSLTETVARYPSEQRPSSLGGSRLDLGSGAFADLYGGGVSAFAVSYGVVRIPIWGQPPPPAGQTRPPDASPRSEFVSDEAVSDGLTIWTAPGSPA